MLEEQYACVCVRTCKPLTTIIIKWPVHKPLETGVLQYVCPLLPLYHHERKFCFLAGFRNTACVNHVIQFSNNQYFIICYN